jgi:transposase
MNAEQKLLAKSLLEENKSVSEIAKTFNVNKATIYRLQDH